MARLGLLPALILLSLPGLAARAESLPGALNSLPQGFKGLHKTVVLDYVPVPARGLAFADNAMRFQSRFNEAASPELVDLVRGSVDFLRTDLGKYSFTLGGGDEKAEDIPLEFAYVALGLHDKFEAFLEAYGTSRLGGPELSSILYVGLDESSLSFYLSRFSFTSSELCLIVSNLIRHGESELALWLADREGEALDPEGGYSTALAASAIEARDLPSLTRLLALLPGVDRAALRELCLLRDFPEGMAPLFDPEADDFPLLKEAFSLANSQFVELLLPRYPRSHISIPAAASLVEAAIDQGRPRNDYLYILLLVGGYDDGQHYADKALEDILVSKDYRPGLELGLRRNLGDLLIGHGANVNRADPFYGPYLHWFASLTSASLAEKREMLRWLISRGADRWARKDGLLYSEIPLSDKAVINEKGVRLRKTPSLKGELITRLDQGTLVYIREMGETELSLEDYTGLWYRVEVVGGAQGWVYGKYLQYVD